MVLVCTSRKRRRRRRRQRRRSRKKKDVERSSYLTKRPEVPDSWFRLWCMACRRKVWDEEDRRRHPEPQDIDEDPGPRDIDEERPPWVLDLNRYHPKNIFKRRRLRREVRVACRWNVRADADRLHSEPRDIDDERPPWLSDINGDYQSRWLQ